MLRLRISGSSSQLLQWSPNLVGSIDIQQMLWWSVFILQTGSTSQATQEDCEKEMKNGKALNVCKAQSHWKVDSNPSQNAEESNNYYRRLL